MEEEMAMSELLAMLKWALVFLVVALAIGVNMPDNMLVRYGLESSALTVALAAVALTGMIAYRRLGLVFFMVLLVVGANLPERAVFGYEIDREVLLATLIALIIIPFIQRQLED
jgi:hypothetical protein